MGKSIHNKNAGYAALQGFFWVGIGVAMSFGAVILQDRGYSNSQLGLVMALGNVGGFFLSPMLASKVDSSERISVFHMLLGLLSLQALSITSIIFTPGKGLLVSAMYGLYLAAMICVNPMLTQLCFELSRSGKEINYGAARGFGSIFFAGAVIIMGILVQRIGSYTLLYLGLAVIILQAVTIISLKTHSDLKPECSSEQRVLKSNSMPLSRFIANNPRFCVLLLGTAVLYFSHNLANNYLINVVRNAGGDAEGLGNLNAFMAALEFPVMLFYDRLTAKFRCSSTLRLSAVFFAVKAFAIALAPDMPGLYAAHLLQTLSFALITPAIVRYVNISVSRADSTKGQSLAFAMSTLGSIFSSLLGGIMYDDLGVKTTLLFGAAACTVGALICQLGIPKGKE